MCVFQYKLNASVGLVLGTCACQCQVLLCVFQYQRCSPAAPQGPPAVPPASDQQWRLCQTEQGHPQHAEDR